MFAAFCCPHLTFLLALMSSGVVFLFGDLHVRFQACGGWINAVDDVWRWDDVAISIVDGVIIVTSFTLNDGKAIGVMQVVVELVA